MHFLELLVTSFSQLVADFFPSADEKKTDAAVRIALAMIILLLVVLMPIYLFFR
jgi:hypothetical protein